MNKEEAKILFFSPNKLKSLKRYSRNIYDDIVTMTIFLPKTALLKARLWHIMNEVNYVITCKMCNNAVKWDDTAKSSEQNYRQYCSHKCMSSDPTYQNNRQTTITNRYGKGLKEIVAKTKKTNLKKYGVENPMMLDSTKAKRNNTCLEKYDVENPAKVKRFIEARKETNIKRFGHEHAAQSSQAKTKTNKAYIKNHGSVKQRYENSTKKCIDTMTRKYGCRGYTQIYIAPTSLKRLNDPIWLIEQYNIKTLVEIANMLEVAQSTVGRYMQYHRIDVLPRFPISNDSKQKINNKSWLYEKYITENLSTSAISAILSVSAGLVLKKIHEFNIPIQRNSMSIGEYEISCFLKTLHINYIPNNRNIIAPLELDFYLPDHNLAIEFNGNYWHSELQGKDKHYHLNKTQLCHEKGIQLIHIFESEWLLKQDIIKSRLQNALGQSKKIFARKCQIVNVSTTTRRQFLESNHLQGNVGSRVNYGLTYKDELVAVMTFGKTRFSKKYEYELLRFATKCGTNVVGGASRLFKHFTNEVKPTTVVSYGDLRFGTGRLYQKLGFDFLHNSKPNYFYFHKSDALTLQSRIKFQKHKLENLLETFDPELTEWENMYKNDYNRIWDCGNSVWVWTPIMHSFG